MVDRPVSLCPNCGAETVKKFRPFCSRHCKLVDLGRWLSEGYVIPGRRTGDTPPTANGEDRDDSG